MIPRIAIRAREPSDALMAAFMSDDAEEFFRLHAEMYPDEDEETQLDAEMQTLRHGGRHGL